MKKGASRHKKLDKMLNCKKCKECEQWFPLNDEYFYLMKNGADGYSKVCKSCFKKRVIKNRRLQKEMDRKNKAISRIKYEEFKQYKPSNNKIEIWNKPINNIIICILQCRSCNKLLNEYTFTKKYNFYKCFCGANLIYFGSINFLNANPVYLHKSIKNNSLFSYDRYK